MDRSDTPRTRIEEIRRRIVEGSIPEEFHFLTLNMERDVDVEGIGFQTVGKGERRGKVRRLSLQLGYSVM
jgi:hypothetical protein